MRHRAWWVLVAAWVFTGSASAQTGRAFVPIGTAVGQPVGSPSYSTLSFDNKPSPFGSPGMSFTSTVDSGALAAPVLNPATAAQDGFFSKFLRSLADLVPFQRTATPPSRWIPSMSGSRAVKKKREELARRQQDN